MKTNFETATFFTKQNSCSPASSLTYYYRPFRDSNVKFSAKFHQESVPELQSALQKSPPARSASSRTPMTPSLLQNSQGGNKLKQPQNNIPTNDLHPCKGNHLSFVFVGARTSSLLSHPNLLSYFFSSCNQCRPQ